MTSKGQTGKKEAEEINGGVDMKKLGELTDSELLTLEKSWDEKKWTTEENTLFWYAIVQEIIIRFQQVVDKKENGYVLAKITINLNPGEFERLTATALYHNVPIGTVIKKAIEDADKSTRKTKVNKYAQFSKIPQNASYTEQRTCPHFCTSCQEEERKDMAPRVA